MPETETAPIPTDAYHRKMAVDLFNATWTLIEKPDRTPAEIDRMVHGAHASCYHWMQVGTPLNQARGEWQIAHVYVLLGRAESAHDHACRYLELCEQHGYADFDLAYAHLELARVFALKADFAACSRHYQQVLQAGNEIAEAEDRAQFESDVKSEPWFGFVPGDR